jgi:hypothetical protein
MPREWGTVSQRHCEERKRRSNPLLLALPLYGLLRFARNDDLGFLKMNKAVIAGLDPAIHLLRKIFAKRDGYAGQARV